MPNAVGNFFTSKKGLAMMVGVLLGFVLLKYCGMTETQTALILSPIGAYEIGQGMADFGKEKK